MIRAFRVMVGVALAALIGVATQASAAGSLEELLQETKNARARAAQANAAREKEFIAIEDDTEHECVVDDRPKLDPERPEVRRYFAMLLYGGEETRHKSNEVVLTVP